MEIAQGKKESTLYLTRKQRSIDVVEIYVNSDTWHCKLVYISEKGIEILYSKGKFLGLKVLDFEYCKDCILEK